MNEQIKDLLRNHFAYSEQALNNYYRIADIRVKNGAQHRKQMNAIVANEDGVLDKVLNNVEFANYREELKRLNLSNLKFWVKENINPVMKKYLEAFIEEQEQSHLITPSSQLKMAEYEMLQYLFDSDFDETLEHIEHIANKTLRYTLQTWILYPEYVCDKESCREVLAILDISNCKL